jgi:hypothetical protein
MPNLTWRTIPPAAIVPPYLPPVLTPIQFVSVPSFRAVRVRPPSPRPEKRRQIFLPGRVCVPPTSPRHAFASPRHRPTHVDNVARQSINKVRHRRRRKPAACVVKSSVRLVLIRPPREAAGRHRCWRWRRAADGGRRGAVPNQVITAIACLGLSGSRLRGRKQQNRIKVSLRRRRQPSPPRRRALFF